MKLRGCYNSEGIKIAAFLQQRCQLCQNCIVFDSEQNRISQNVIFSDSSSPKNHKSDAVYACRAYEFLGKVKSVCDKWKKRWHKSCCQGNPGIQKHNFIPTKRLFHLTHVANVSQPQCWGWVLRPLTFVDAGCTFKKNPRGLKMNEDWPSSWDLLKLFHWDPQVNVLSIVMSSAKARSCLMAHEMQVTCHTDGSSPAQPCRSPPRLKNN